MKAIRENLEALGGKLDRLFEKAAEAVATGAAELNEQADTLLDAHRQQELAFRDLIARHDQARGAATERADLERKRNDLLAKDRRKTELRRQVERLHAERAELTGQLNRLWEERFAMRRRVADWINSSTKSPIRVRVDQCGDRSAYQQALAGWMKGFVGQFNPAARKIADYVPPAELLRIAREQLTDELQTRRNWATAKSPRRWRP